MIPSLNDLLTRITNTPECILHPKTESKLITDSNLSLPDDIKYFYQLCDGMDLYRDSEWPFCISKPIQFLKTDRVIFRNLTEQELVELTLDSITVNWYVIGKGDFSPHISIDLSPERHGWCFNSDWQVYPGGSYVIAKSFTEFLYQIIEAEGKYEFWDEIPDNERIYPGDFGFFK